MKERHTKDAQGHKHQAHKEVEEAKAAAEVAAEDGTPSPEGSNTDQPADRLLRLQADFDNFRKRTTRERTEFARRATEDLVAELLPVLDHFELGLKNALEHDADVAVCNGFQLVYDQFMGVLAKAGLSPIDATGQVFDPHQHEAVTHMPSEEAPADMVMHQTRRGYRLGDRLLRAAQVVVSSGPADGSGTGDAAGESGISQQTPEEQM